MIDDITHSELLKGLSRQDLELLEPELEWVNLSGGQILFRQGDPPDGLYIVASGRLCATGRTSGGDDVMRREMGRGDSIGELALITGEPRVASVRALRDSTLIRLSSAGFDHLRTAHPHMTLHLTRMIIRRYEAEAPKPASFTTFSIIPAAPYPWLGEFVTGLIEALGESASSTWVDSRRVDHHFGAGAAQSDQGADRQRRILAWLDHLESDHQYLIYLADSCLADSETTPWSKLCLRQADRLLFVTEGEQPSLGTPPLPPVNEPVNESVDESVEEPISEFGHRSRRTEWVLVRSPSSTQQLPTPWLSRVPARVRHHVNLAKPATLSRLARRMTDRAIGLALGGGGSRCLAHIGLFRALEEAGIPIDIVSSTSGGSIMGAMHVAGWDAATMLRRVREFTWRRRWIFDLGPPLASLVDSRGFERTLKSFYGEACLENLEVPLLAVASNLTSAQLHVPEEGPLWLAVRASMSLPAFWPPVEVDGQLLVDGGMLNNLPADLLRESCAGGKVIACNVSGLFRPPIETRYGHHLSGWRVLWNRLNPWAKKFDVPSLFEVGIEAATLSSAMHAESVASQVDLYLEPPVAQHGLFEIWAEEFAPMIEELGYRHAKEKLEGWSWQGCGL